MDEAELVGRHKETGAAESSDYQFGHDVAAEARVRRKLDWNMMPLFFVLCKYPPSPTALPVGACDS